MKANQVIGIVASMAMVLSMAVCGGNAECGGNNFGKNEVELSASAETNAFEEENVQIPNPWTECSDIKAAEENAGFSFGIPEAIEGYKVAWIQNLDKEMIEVIYEKTDDAGESEEDYTIHLRKGIGTEDISGDYNDYAESNQVTIGSYNVTMQGNNGSVSLATWTDGGFSYAVSVPEMSAESVTAIIQQMN